MVLPPGVILSSFSKPFSPFIMVSLGDHDRVPQPPCPLQHVRPPERMEWKRQSSQR
jgi:hypothetical protein